MRPWTSQSARWAAEDLAQMATEWDHAAALLEPGRERSWHRPVPTEEQRQIEAAHVRADRAGKAENARRGLTAVGEAPAPLRLHVLEAMTRAAAPIEALAADLRTRAGLGPLTMWRDPPAGRTEADVRFRAARDWLATAGIHTVAGDELVDVAASIRRALRRLTAVTNPAPFTRALHAPCPVCDRRALRAHLDADDRRSWTVVCHAPDCRAMWPWAEWGTLSDVLGVDVLDTLEGAIT